MNKKEIQSVLRTLNRTAIFKAAKQHGVDVVSGGDQCSFSQSNEYFSYRRHAKTGRMATFVFMQ